jgi:hypothetical protein
MNDEVREFFLLLFQRDCSSKPHCLRRVRELANIHVARLIVVGIEGRAK